MSGKDNVGTSGGVAIDKTEGSGHDDCSSFDTLNVAIRWPRTHPALPQAGHAGAALHSSVIRRFCQLVRSVGNSAFRECVDRAQWPNILGS